jgi:hypothetical protein
VNDRWRVSGIIWALGALGLVVGSFVYFLPHMAPLEALRWGLISAVKMMFVFTVFASFIAALWATAGPSGPRGPSGPGGSGPMSTAG